MVEIKAKVFLAAIATALIAKWLGAGWHFSWLFLVSFLGWAALLILLVAAGVDRGSSERERETGAMTVERRTRQDAMGVVLAALLGTG